MNTCDKCNHYAHDPSYGDRGYCEMMGDSNSVGEDDEFPQNGAMGWDFEGYRAGVHVGPKFGCIHFERGAGVKRR